MTRGEIWWADTPGPWGRRPVLLIARETAFERLSAVNAAPVTTTIRIAPSIVRLNPQRDGVPRACVVNLDALLTVDVELLDALITTLAPARMREVDRALHFALGLRD